MTTETNYRILDKDEPVQKGDEFFWGDAWHKASNWKHYQPKQGNNMYRRPMPASRPYCPKWKRPDAPGCPVHVLWAESPSSVRTVAQVAADAKPEALKQKIEPGTGYRLLGDDEIVHLGDEWYNPGRITGDWSKATGSVGLTVASMASIYRRKLPAEPQYRPYANAAEAAAGLQGKLIRHTGTGKYYPVTCISVDQVIVAEDGVTFYGLQKYWKFTDGTPCGVLITNQGNK